MITESFIFLDRITSQSEKNLWISGINNWEDFLNADKIKGISDKRKLFYDSQLRKAKELLLKKDLISLSKLFPQREHWRLYKLFKEKIAIDIETSGYYGDITVLGISNEEETKFLLKNKNLDSFYLEKVFQSPSIILSFNGASFDIPVIIRNFPKLEKIMKEQAHIDLRHVAAKLGYEGGLKAIEISLGINRGEISGMDGGMAGMLWELYNLGDEEALELLLEYNKADVENLFLIADMLIPRLWEKIYC